MRPSAPDASAQATCSRRALRASRKTLHRSVRPAAPRKRVVEGPRAPTLHGGGARGVRSSSALLLTGSAPGNVEVSSRRCRGLTTRGVRADRVGIKLSHRRPKGWPRAEVPAAKVARLLARETSTGGRSRGRMGSRPRPAKVLGGPQGLLGAGETAPLVSGAGTRLSSEAEGDGANPQDPKRLARERGPTAARKQRRRVERATRASARWLRSYAPGTRLRRSGGRARGLCWLQKSTSGAWSRPKGHGSSSLAHTRKRASAEGEAAPEAGSRWRKPRAREQRHRWRAPRDPTRSARKRGARPGEGALGDGRRPGRAKAAVFDETTGEPGLVTRGDGDSAALSREKPGPLRITTEDVRGYVASSARGRRHRSREVQRGGAVDRGSARTALHRTRERLGPRLRARLRAAFGYHVLVAAQAEAGASPSSAAPPGWLIR
jgi:hypothetical protein